MKAWRETITTRKTPRTQVKGWTMRLTNLKKRTYQARRNAQNKEEEQEKDTATIRYRNTYRNYRVEVRRAKRNSWRQFVESESRKDAWGIIYKLANKRLTPRQAGTAIGQRHDHTMTWEATVEALLDAFIIKHPADEDTLAQLQTRERAKRQVMHTMESDYPTEPIVEGVIRNLKNGKAPGMDLIEANILKAAWTVVRKIYTKLYKACFEKSVFPKNWKRGRIHTVLKTGNKDPTDVCSYRPVTLLPIPAKILETLILRRLQEHFEDENIFTNTFRYQFGFTGGRSTTDAITLLLRQVKQANTKYVMGLFIDIKGAFDHLWWPDILKALEEKNTPPDIYNIIRQYLNQREVCIQEGERSVTKRQVRGCPQGSVLGPVLWNIVFDPLLDLLNENGTTAIGYADDVVVLVTGKSRNELEAYGEQAIKGAERWCSNHKLKLSKDKTVALMLKGKFDEERRPRIPLLGKNIKFKSEVRYLGILLTEGLGLTAHVKYIANKAKTTMNNMVSVVKANWGVGYRELHRIYRGAFEPVITYAPPAWANALNKQQVKIITSAQRKAAIRCVRAYNTISTPASLLLAGMLPLIYRIEQLTLRYMHKKGETLSIRELNFTAEGELSEKMKTLQTEQMENWQTEWDSESRGRTTYEFFPRVKERLQATWFNPGYYTTQLTSGHGNIRSKLRRFNLMNTDTCHCGREETLQHIILHCPTYEEQRAQLMEAVKEARGNWPPPMEALVAEECFQQFGKFAETVLKMKEEIDRTG